MNPTTRNIVIGVVVVVIVVLLGYFAFEERQNSGANMPPVSTTATSTAISTGTSITVGNTKTSSGGYTITPIYASTSSAPSYKTPLTYPANMSADEQAQYQSEFATIQTTLATTSTDWGSWIDLGTLRQDTGDYQGAKADWTYVTEIYPKDPTAYADLGNLYATYLSNNTQAIADYKEAITLDPVKEVSFYQNLAQVYVGEGDTADAKAVLEEGIAAQVAGYQGLQTELNSMQ